ncbi:MAG: DNA recombination protein RmuC [Odoribacteraceae bacterium]|jgi:DNA recombination protein RmuC|nr:DNA recombination protein RmuC [Odoribacteraceae bacterium]
MITTILILVGLLLVAVILVIAPVRGLSGSEKEIARSLAKIEGDLSRVDSLVREEFGRNREESRRDFKENREELGRSFKLLGETLTGNVTDLSLAQKNQFDTFSRQLESLVKTFDERTRNLQEQLEKSARANRVEQGQSLNAFEEKFTRDVRMLLNEIRETVEKRLTSLQEDNNKKLEAMRATVDEKLQESVEKRFNESFRLINERLESVHKGLGEMQALATGVGDLKKVLTNVKTRGTFGEVQLGAILEQVLSPEQYIKNDHPGDDRKVVEYSIKLPGRNDNDEPVLLPVDSKFPLEVYQRLVDAYENSAGLVEGLAKQLESSVRGCAREIRDKYIRPPRTTDFAILFVPTEGLYAEILRRPGFFELLQREFRVTVVGPTNLVAFLSSLQMGFRTLAIEKRSSEVWEILGAVKSEFGKFGDVLGKTRKKLQEAANVIGDAGTRSRVIERKLKSVQELPRERAISLLGEAAGDGVGDDAGDGVGDDVAGEDDALPVD